MQRPTAKIGAATMAIGSVDRTAVLESGLLLGERWVRNAKGGTMEHVNAVTGKVQGAFAVASTEEVDEAVEAARRAFIEWRRWDPERRRQVLIRLAELIEANAETVGTISSLETGSLFRTSAAEHAASWYRYYAGWADKISGES